MPRHGILYGYRVDGPHDWHQGHRFDIKNILIDPYAKLIEGRRVFGDASNKLSTFFGTYDFDSLPFDWGEDYKAPGVPEVINMNKVNGVLPICFVGDSRCCLF